MLSRFIPEQRSAKIGIPAAVPLIRRPQVLKHCGRRGFQKNFWDGLGKNLGRTNVTDQNDL